MTCALFFARFFSVRFIVSVHDAETYAVSDMRVQCGLHHTDIFKWAEIGHNLNKR